MVKTKYPQDLLPEGVKYELMVRQPGPEISDAIIDPFGSVSRRDGEATSREDGQGEGLTRGAQKDINSCD